MEVGKYINIYLIQKFNKDMQEITRKERIERSIRCQKVVFFSSLVISYTHRTVTKVHVEYTN